MLKQQRFCFTFVTDCFEIVCFSFDQFVERYQELYKITAADIFAIQLLQVGINHEIKYFLHIRFLAAG